MRRRVILKTVYSILLWFIFIGGAANNIIAQEIQKEEVVFKSGELVLSGTLVLPDTAKNVPIIVFIGGMEDWGDFHPQREVFIRDNLESIFPKAGIGVFYYDPRGVDNSDGRWGPTTFSEFADDAKAAIHFLKQRKEIDPNRIGLVGHGEDGWVAQIIAAENTPGIKLVALLGGPTFDSTTQLVNQYHSEYVCAGEDSTIAHEKAVQKALSHQNWVSFLPLTKRWRHMKMKLDFDPAPYIANIDIPALFMFGSNDGDVYPSWAIQKLNDIYPDSLPQNFDIFTISGANNYFHVTDTCFDYPEDEERVEKNFSFHFKEVFQNWIFENL